MGRVTRRSVASKEESTPKESPKSSGRRGAKKDKPGAEDVTEVDSQETPKRGGRQTVKDEQKADVSAKGRSTARGRSTSRGGRGKKEEEPEAEDITNEEEVEEKKAPRGSTRSRGKGKADEEEKTTKTGQNAVRGGRGVKLSGAGETDDEEDEESGNKDDNKTIENNGPAKSSGRRVKAKAATVAPSPRGDRRSRGKATAEPDEEDKIEDGESNHEDAEQPKVGDNDSETVPKGRQRNVAAKKADSSEATPSPGARKGRSQMPAPKTTPASARSSRRSGAANNSADKTSDTAETTEDMDTTEDTVKPQTSDEKVELPSTETKLKDTEPLASEKAAGEIEKTSAVVEGKTPALTSETSPDQTKEVATEKKETIEKAATAVTGDTSNNEEAAMETEDTPVSEIASTENEVSSTAAGVTLILEKPLTEKEQSDVVVEEAPAAASVSKKRKLESEEDDSSEARCQKKHKQEEGCVGETVTKQDRTEITGDKQIHTEEPVKGDKQPSTKTEEPVKEDKQPSTKTEEPVKEDKQPSSKTEEPVKEDKQPSAETSKPIEEDKQSTTEPIHEDKQASTETSEPVEKEKQPSTEISAQDNAMLVDAEEEPTIIDGNPPLDAGGPSPEAVSESQTSEANTLKQIKESPSPTKNQIASPRTAEVPSPHKNSSDSAHVTPGAVQPQHVSTPDSVTDNSHSSKGLPEEMEVQTESSALTHVSNDGTAHSEQVPCQNGTAEISVGSHPAPSPNTKSSPTVHKPYVPSSTAIDSRKFISNPDFPIEMMDPAYCISVVSYNILADCHLTSGDYSYTQPQYLAQGYRHSLLLKELDYLDGDIVCLQEVGSTYYSQTLLPALKSRGYDGHFIKRTRDNKDEGEATFVRTSKLDVVSHQSATLKDLAFKEVATSGLPEDVSTAVKKYLDRTDVILLTELKCKKTGKVLTVCNIHVVHDVSAPDVQCVQVACAIKELVAKAGSDLSPHIICGDFNSDVTSPVFHLVSHGQLSDDHIHRLQSLQALDNADGSSCSLIHHILGAFRHTSTSLKNTYEVALGKEPPVTYYRKATKSLDHIFHSSASIDSVGVLETLDVEVLRASGGLPNKTIPSDHLSIKALFRLK